MSTQRKNINAIVASRTVWAAVFLAIVALFNIFASHLIPSTPSAKLASASLVCAFLAAVIYFRAKARNLLKVGYDDKSILSLVIMPLLLTSIFTQGCMVSGTRDTWDRLTPAEKTLVVADSLQKGYLKLKELYTDVYNQVPTSTRDAMASKIAPKINAAQPVIELFVEAAVIWNETHIKPANIDVLQADAQAAYARVSDEIQSITKNPERITP